MDKLFPPPLPTISAYRNTFKSYAVTLEPSVSCAGKVTQFWHTFHLHLLPGPHINPFNLDRFVATDPDNTSLWVTLYYKEGHGRYNKWGRHIARWHGRRVCSEVESLSKMKYHDEYGWAFILYTSHRHISSLCCPPLTWAPSPLDCPFHRH